MADAAQETTEVVTTDKVWSWPGLHPHAIGARIRLAADHVEDLVLGGHVEHVKPEEPEEAAAPEVAEPPAASA